MRLLWIFVVLVASGATYQTPNFRVTAPTPEFAKQVGGAAEKFRQELAVEWLGHELPRWSAPCPVFVKAGPNVLNFGVTNRVFDKGEVFGWEMKVEGTPERILDSVLPHEVTHAVLSSHFREPAPRWADEGAAANVEHPEEKTLQDKKLVAFLKTGQGIPFSTMFATKEYPRNYEAFYAQGYSVSAFLIEQGGRRAFVDFLGAGLKSKNWPAAIEGHYGYGSLGQLQNTWLEWVKDGSPKNAHRTAYQGVCVNGVCPRYVPRQGWSLGIGLGIGGQRTAPVRQPIVQPRPPQPQQPWRPSQQPVTPPLVQVKEGPPGREGKQGPRGFPGEDGKDGRDGRDGEPGPVAEIDYAKLAAAEAAQLKIDEEAMFQRLMARFMAAKDPDGNSLWLFSIGAKDHEGNITMPLQPVHLRDGVFVHVEAPALQGQTSAR